MSFSVFGLTGYWYGLTIGISALAYLWTAGMLGFSKRLPTGTVRLYGLFALPLGLVLSRLVYCAVNFSYYTESVSQPWLMLRFWDGGYSLLGALAGMIVAAYWTARVRKVRFGTLLDVTTVPLGLLLFGVRMAEEFTGGQLGVGRQVNAGTLALTFPGLFIPDQMGTLTLYRLAVYRFEAIAALLLLVLALLLFLSRHGKYGARAGDMAMMTYALFGAMQVPLESLRDDGHMVLGFIRVQQVGSALLPVLVLLILAVRYAHIRQVRKATVAAWLLLPVALVVAYMMGRPINHVLNLTDKRALGGVILAAIGVYMLFFLRVRGADLRLIVTWLVTILAIAVCVMVEFSVDGSDNLVRDYAIMAAGCLVLFLAPYSLWKKLKNGVYREESIRICIPVS